jgi:hypothetical protein
MGMIGLMAVARNAAAVVSDVFAIDCKALL